MITKETLFEISRLCRKAIVSVGRFDLTLLEIELGDVAPSVLDYFNSNVPETSVFARTCSSRDLCRLYQLRDLVDMNMNAVPSCYILNYGFVAFGSDLSGDAFTVDVISGDIYLVSHEEDWEELIAENADELGGARAVVAEYSEHVTDSIEQFLDTLLYQLREVDRKEREFYDLAMSDPGAVNDDGNTLLIVAIKENDFQRFQKIIELGANIEVISAQDRPAVSEATVYGRVDMVKILLERGANPNSVNSKGQTPLMIAAWYSQTDCARILLDSGADKSLRDNDNRVAVDHINTFRKEPELFGLLSLNG